MQQIPQRLLHQDLGMWIEKAIGKGSKKKKESSRRAERQRPTHPLAVLLSKPKTSKQHLISVFFFFSISSYILL